MSVERFKKCVDEEDTSGAVLALESIEDVNALHNILGINTVLTYVLDCFMPDLVAPILAAGANPNIKNAESEMPLHLACKLVSVPGYLNSCSLLVLKGANINGTGIYKRTPLFVACAQESLDLCEMLIKAGADPNIQDVIGMTPLHVAITIGHIGIVEVLLENKANPNAPTRQGITPLETATVYNQTDIFQMLLKAGAQQQ